MSATFDSTRSLSKSGVRKQGKPHDYSNYNSRYFNRIIGSNYQNRSKLPYGLRTHLEEISSLTVGEGGQSQSEMPLTHGNYNFSPNSGKSGSYRSWVRKTPKE
jgi:hypothetical protein